MIKVIAKTFGILEHLAAEPEREVPLTEIAAATGVNKATAARILKDLVEAGYAYQAANRKGYTLGPMAGALGARNGFRRDLTGPAAPRVAACAKRIRESVLVAVLQGGHRYVLCHENGNPELEITLDRGWYDDLYIVATGRLLLAYAAADEVAAVFKRYGAPLERWDGIRTLGGMQERLAEIRKAGRVVTDSPNGNLAILAFPIVCNGRVEAALGISVPRGTFTGKKRTEIIAAGAATAAEIGAEMEARSGRRHAGGKKPAYPA